MEKGCYIVRKHEEIENDIDFSIKPNVSQVTENQQKLHLEIEKALMIVRQLFKDSPIELENYFSQLLTLAQAGLTPEENAQPTISLNALQQLKLEIVDKKSGGIKNGYFKDLGFTAIKIGILPLSCAIAIKTFYYFSDDKILENLSVFSNFLYIWCSSLLGVWISFGARKTILTFEELISIEEDKLEPTLRMLFIGCISIIFSLLFYKQAVTLEIGAISSKEISSDAFVSIIFGFFLGLSEKVLGQKITKKAASVFESF